MKNLVLTWLADSWPVIAPVVWSFTLGVCVHIVQWVTPHASGYRHAVKALLYLTEYLTFAKSRDTPGWFKMIFTSRPPPKPGAPPPSRS